MLDAACAGLQLAVIVSTATVAQTNATQLAFPHDRTVEIQLSQEDPPMEGRGPGRWIEHEVAFSGTLHIWTRSDLDLFLRVDDEDAELLAEDDDSGGGTTPYVQLQVEPGDLVRVGVAATDPAGGGAVEVTLIASTETELTRAAAERASGHLTEVAALEQEGALDEARQTLKETLELLGSAEVQPQSESVAAAARLAASSASRLHSIDTTKALLKLSHDHLKRTRPPHHPDRIRVQMDLASALRRDGDLAGARVLQESVLAALRRTAPEDDFLLLAAHVNLSNTLKGQGHLGEARLLLEKALPGFQRTLAKDDPTLLATRVNLAGTIRQLGDVAAARAILESALEDFENKLPSNHHLILGARLHLALAMQRQGDFSGARAIQEEVLAARLDTLPADHPSLLRTRLNLATTIRRQGDAEGARQLLEDLVADYGRAAKEDARDRLRAHMNLGTTLWELRDLKGARNHLETALSGLEQSLPAGHHEVLMARMNLAVVMFDERDVSGAIECLKAALEARTDAPWETATLKAQANLAFMMYEHGDLDGGGAMSLEVAQRTRQRLAWAASSLSHRESRAVVAYDTNRHSLLRWFSMFPGSPISASDRFELAETMRHVASLDLGAHVRADPEISRIRSEVATVRTRIGDLGAARAVDAGTSELSELARTRDKLEGRLRGELATRGALVGPVRVQDVVRGLTAGSVAVGFVRTIGWKRDPDSGSFVPRGDVLSAQAVSEDGSLVEIELGLASELEELVRGWRRSVGANLSGGSGGAGDDTPGPDRERDESTSRTGRGLRERLLDPLLERLSPDVDTLFVCPTDLVHVVPLDALPLEDGFVGDQYRLVTLVSMRRLVEAPPPLSDDASDGLIAVGAVAFDGEAGPLVSPVGASPPVEERGPGGARSAHYPGLPGTRAEVDRVGDLFRTTFDRDPVVLTDREATKAAFHRQAPGRRFLHVATHGWFKGLDFSSAPPLDAARSLLGSTEAVTAFAPLSMCGLALAGANHGRDELGRVPGILTAEELAAIDLSGCELAVLSACETNVGIRSAGLGIQSLQSGLHAAGVRTAITSLWKVDDGATRELMERIYTYLWVEKMPKADALWKAKCDLRANRYPLRDWAGWVLSGDPQ